MRLLFRSRGHAARGNPGARSGKRGGAATQPEELSNMLQSFTGDTQQAGGEWAAAVQRADEGRCIASNSRPMQSASLIKLFVAATVEENRDMVTAGEQYSGETAGLLFSMLSQSDNEAANTLVRRLGGGDAAAGMALVNQYCAANGYEDTSMGRLMLGFSSAGG